MAALTPAERLIHVRRHPAESPLVMFYGHRPAGSGTGPWVLSNFWPAAFVVDGQRYLHNEQFMMAAKARLFGDEQTRALILAERRPFEVKKLGRQVRGFDTTVWDAQCYETVLAGLLAKFGQNTDLGRYLAQTAPALLVEASPSDRIWGIGLSASDPAAHDPRQWRGRNLLGFALTECRQRLAGGRTP